MGVRFDPEKHHRHSIRMPGYDYTEPGAYFVTICCQNRECLFDDPVLRSVVETHWQNIPGHVPNATLDAWVVMPNHLHGIIVIIPGADMVGASHSPAGLGTTQRHTSPQGHRSDGGFTGSDSPLQRPQPHGAPPGSLGK